MAWLQTATKEQLQDALQTIRKTNKYKKMKDATIIKKLINDEIDYWITRDQWEEQRRRKLK